MQKEEAEEVHTRSDIGASPENRLRRDCKLANRA